MKKGVRNLDPNKAFSEAKRDWEETRLRSIAAVYTISIMYGFFTKTTIVHGALLFSRSYLQHKTGKELALALPADNAEDLNKFNSKVSDSVAAIFIAACVYKMCHKA